MFVTKKKYNELEKLFKKINIQRAELIINKIKYKNALKLIYSFKDKKSIDWKFQKDEIMMIADKTLNDKIDL